MSLQTVITEIERLKLELDSLYPIPDDRLQKINYKFRLEWNYHSNKMEGGTLTFEETRSVMMEQLDVRGKPLRDVMEMRGHDEVIKNIQKIGKGEVRLTENRIKEIHKTIIFEEDNTPGVFKKRNNYIYNYQGERFDFTPEEDTIEAVNSLTNWLDNELNALKKKKSKKSVPQIAFEYHLRFLTIHPFLDGNGRTGRILMNLILISHGYPPVIIKTEEKELYGKHIAHAQQYEENPVPLYEMLGNLLIRSFEICLKGAKGESIFDMEDWEKRLQQLEYKTVDKRNELLKTDDIVFSILKTSYIPLLEYADIKFSKFDNFYNRKSQVILFNDNIISNIDDLKTHINISFEQNKLKDLDSLNCSFKWYDFKLYNKKVKDISIQIAIFYKQNGYQITRLGLQFPFIAKEYGKSVSQEEINLFVNSIGNIITEEFESKLKEP